MNEMCDCPRCGDQAYEQLQTYSHCVSCLYFEDRYHSAERSYFEARRAEQLIEEALVKPKAIVRKIQKRELALVSAV